MLIRDRYRLETVLGQGGMGQVWRAHDALLDRPVAVKLLDSRAADETAAARFTLEARTAGRLSHPHVVAVHDFGAVDDRLYLVMELVEGSSLAAVIATAGRLDAHDVGVWGGQAASALAAAHRERIVHRDIKPSNLLVTADGMIKVGDFGIARFASEASAGMTRTGMIIGTAAYLAPERALGRASGPPSDMYALGCVLYELLAGSPRSAPTPPPPCCTSMSRHCPPTCAMTAPTSPTRWPSSSGGCWTRNRAGAPRPIRSPRASPTRPPSRRRRPRCTR